MDKARSIPSQEILLAFIKALHVNNSAAFSKGDPHLGSQFIKNYTGFCGQINPEKSGIPTYVCCRLGTLPTPLSGGNGAIQWVNPAYDQKDAFLSPTPGEQLFLAGLLRQQENVPLEQRIAALLNENRYSELATIVENSSGCFITNGRVYFWVGFASEDYVFLREIQGSREIIWSTNPLDLVRSNEDVHPWNLRRCCHGDDVFVYDEKRIQRIEQGHLVVIRFDGPNVQVNDVQFDRFLPERRLTHGRSTEIFIQRTREALVNAVRPLLDEERVGIMLSGGVGSAALLCAMKEVGVNVIAYHIESENPTGSEYRYARMTCEALDVPLVHLPMSSGPDFLSPTWKFTHPDAHPWVRWFEQICVQACKDRVTLMVTGAGDDHAYGPEIEYGLHSILSAWIPWVEKRAILRGLLSTDWNLFDILRSAWPWPPHQLIGLNYLAGPSQEDLRMRRADFLTPLSSVHREVDAALFHSPCFAPQSLAIEQTIVQPNGIRLVYPYHDREVQSISLALPAAYRLMPRASLGSDAARYVPTSERIVGKPILRLACRDTPLPPEVVWRTWTMCTQAPIQEFCLNHTKILREILGGSSRLASLGIVDTARLDWVLGSRVRIRENYTTLIACALVELFLKNALHEQLERGGPQWQ